MAERGPMFRLHMASGASSIDRTGPLTPYAVEDIVDIARRAGAGALLELGLSTNADETCLVGARRHFERLAARGVYVRVRRDPDLDHAA